MLGHAGEARDALARSAIREQALAHRRVKVVADDRVCRVEDVLCRTVVLFQNDDVGAGEILAKFEDVPDVGTPERIDRLVGITNDRQGRRIDAALGVVEHRRGFDRHVLGLHRSCEFMNQFVLRLVGVLVLVHKHVAESTLVQSPNFGERAKQEHGLADEIVEVECVRASQFLGVTAEDFEEHHFVRVVRVRLTRKAVDVDQFVLEAGHLRQHTTGRETHRVSFEFFEDSLDERLRIRRVVDSERLREPEAFGLVAKNAHTRRVECRNPHASRFVADVHPDAFTHFRGRLVSERDRKNLARPGLAVLQQQCDAAREHRRLSRPRPRHDEQGRPAMSDGVRLLGVQPLEERIVGIECGGRVRHVDPSLRALTDSVAKGE